jgi:hypothetical protein
MEISRTTRSGKPPPAPHGKAGRVNILLVVVIVFAVVSWVSVEQAVESAISVSGAEKLARQKVRGRTNDPINNSTASHDGDIPVVIASDVRTGTNTRTVETSTPVLLSTQPPPSTFTAQMANATGCVADPIFKKYFESRRDYLSPLWGKSFSRETHEDSFKAYEMNVFTNKTLLIIGDSLDYFMLSHVCALLHGEKQKLEPDQDMSRPNVCISPALKVGHLNIFGMHRPCENGAHLAKAHPGPYNTTAERIEAMLPKILDLFPAEHNTVGEFYVQIGSNLWDLSPGCNNRLDIAKKYEKEYRKGAIEVATAIQHSIQTHFSSKEGNQGLSAKVHIIWKLAPPVSLTYSNSMLEKGCGRVRSNQEALNNVLMDVVAPHDEMTAEDPTMIHPPLKIGSGIVDLWNLVREIVPSEEVLNEVLKRDGRHFPMCPNLAFFNALLDEIQRLSTRRSTITPTTRTT